MFTPSQVNSIFFTEALNICHKHKASHYNISKFLSPAFVCIMNWSVAWTRTVCFGSLWSQHLLPSQVTPPAHMLFNKVHTLRVWQTHSILLRIVRKKMFLKHLLRNIIFHQTWSIFLKGRLMLKVVNPYILLDTWLSHWEAPLHINPV